MRGRLPPVQLRRRCTSSAAHHVFQGSDQEFRHALRSGLPSSSIYTSFTTGFRRPFDPRPAPYTVASCFHYITSFFLSAQRSISRPHEIHLQNVHGFDVHPLEHYMSRWLATLSYREHMFMSGISLVWEYNQ